MKRIGKLDRQHANRSLFALIAAMFALVHPAFAQPTLSGTVIDYWDNPVSGAKVYIDRTGFQTTTDSKGRFSLSFAPGQFTVVVSKDGYKNKNTDFTFTQNVNVPLAPITVFKIPQPNTLSMAGKNDYVTINRCQITGRNIGGDEGRYSVSGVPSHVSIPDLPEDSSELLFIDTSTNTGSRNRSDPGEPSGLRAFYVGSDGTFHIFNPGATIEATKRGAIEENWKAFVLPNFHGRIVFVSTSLTFGLPIQYVMGDRPCYLLEIGGQQSPFGNETPNPSVLNPHAADSSQPPPTTNEPLTFEAPPDRPASKGFLRRSSPNVDPNLGAMRTKEYALEKDQAFDAIVATFERLKENIALKNKLACSIQGNMKRRGGVLGMLPNYRGFDATCVNLPSGMTRITVSAYYFYPNSNDVNLLESSPPDADKILTEFFEVLDEQASKRIADSKPNEETSSSFNPAEVAWFVENGTPSGFGFGEYVRKNSAGDIISVKNGGTADLIHPGVDIAAPDGARILSPVSGTVVDIISSKDDPDFHKGLGYAVMIILDEKIDDESAYAFLLHLKGPPSITIGKDVISGQTEIGQVGSSGNSSGAHVHFELRDFSSRYLEDSRWNSPFNIYGRATPEAARMLSEHWINPESYFAQKIPAGL